MEVINFEFHKTYHLDKMVVALGQFDGLHLAHRKIIEKVVEESDRNRCKSAVITFYPHPDYILGKREDKGYLTPQKDKIKILSEFHLDYLIIVPFSIELSRTHYLDFENHVLGAFDIFKIIVGFDYRYGAKGQGTVKTLQEKYDVCVIDEVLFADKKMGSTLVREYLISGELEKVKELLGRFYNITGIVVEGSKFGRELGFKTANIELEEEFLDLKHGVYGVLVTVDKIQYIGLCNVGHNPSFNYVAKPRIEVHILNFNQDLYGKEISIDYVFFLREELYFEEKSKLIDQIKCDVNYAEPILKKYL